MKVSRLTFYLFMGILLSGCASGYTNIHLGDGSMVPNDQQSVVFGRFRMDYPLGVNYSAVFTNQETRKRYHIVVANVLIDCPIKGDCSNKPICISLPSGTYEMTAFKTITMGPRTESAPGIKFKVAPSSVAYIGTLTGKSIGPAWGPIQHVFKVEDEHDEEMKAQAESCPGVKDGKYVMSLMDTPYNSAIANVW